jgi:hypothetical protein
MAAMVTQMCHICYVIITLLIVFLFSDIKRAKIKTHLHVKQRSEKVENTFHTSNTLSIHWAVTD